MKAGARAGKIITISSGAYASARVGASHYCASKAGVVMFTRVLAMELAEQRINVNCIAPGYIKMDSETSPMTSTFETALLKNIPWGRLGTPADVAPAALFPGLTGGRLRDRRGAFRQRRGHGGAHVPAAQYTEGALIDSRARYLGKTQRSSAPVLLP
jgi:NAD(P)-dependent dehydrogenase (short-subunit alcohol dehydrogenase family)